MGKKDYFSFMLRLWRAGDDGRPIWRASLENTLTRERLGFANLKELFDYLEVQIKKADRPSDEGSTGSQLTLNIRIDAEIK